MIKVLIVNDVQKDYVYGSVSIPEAYSIIGKIVDEINRFVSDNLYEEYLIIFTQDTHFDKTKLQHKYLEVLDYRETEEGKRFPIMHCEQGTKGWELLDELRSYTEQAKDSLNIHIFEKTNFSSEKLISYFISKRDVFDFEIIGFNADTSILSTAVNLKTYFPEMSVKIKMDCCCAITPMAYNNTLIALQNLNIDLI